MGAGLREPLESINIADHGLLNVGLQLGEFQQVDNARLKFNNNTADKGYTGHMAHATEETIQFNKGICKLSE